MKTMKKTDHTETARGSARDNLEILTPDAAGASRMPPGGNGDGPDLFDPLKPENLRIDQSELDMPAVKPELTVIPVRKPEKFEFVRVHPDPEYRCGPVSFITLGRGEFYIVPPGFRKNLRPILVTLS
jgi:hypothetical protein